MATHQAGVRGLVSRMLGAAWRLVLVVLFTGVETAALVGWLAFVEGAPPVSRASAVGLGILVAGLLLEHFFTDVAVNGVDASFPLVEGVFFSVTEAALWVLWLVVAERVAGLEGLLLAGIVLAVLLVPQHSIEDNVLRGRGLVSNPLVPGTVRFSIVEATGATVWFLFVGREGLGESFLAEIGLPAVEPAIAGVGFLAIALFVEHNLGVAFSRRP